MTDLEQQTFYEDLVRKLRARGVICAITSGLACVHYDIAETTKDCDLLCHPASFPTLLDLLSQTKIDGHDCHYRLQKYVDEAKAALFESGLIPENALTWLPDVMKYFEWLNA